MLHDVALALPGTSQLANPLPLRRLQLLPPELAAAAAMSPDEQQAEQQQDAAAGSSSSSSSLSRAGSRTLLVPATSGSSAAAAAAGGEGDADVYEASEAPHAASWRYFMPCMILDVASKTIGRLQLDLQVRRTRFVCCQRSVCLLHRAVCDCDHPSVDGSTCLHLLWSAVCCVHHHHVLSSK
jgi:hypothetical protein